jgi:hypothetical protein
MVPVASGPFETASSSVNAELIKGTQNSFGANSYYYTNQKDR